MKLCKREQQIKYQIGGFKFIFFLLMSVIPVTPKVDLLVEIEGLLFDGSHECWDKAMELIPKLKNPILISNLILALGEVFPLSFQELYLFCISLKNKNLICTNQIFLDTSVPLYSYIGDYLVKKGIFTKEQLPNLKPVKRTVDEYQNPLYKNDLAIAIYKDDVNTLNEISKKKNLEKEAISFMNDEHLSCLAFAAFVGAEKVVTYLVKNFYEIDEEVIDWAVRGGNENIIQFLASKNASFDNQLENAILYHRNQLFHWLVKNYHSDEKINIAWCVEMFNTEILIYLLSEGHNINERGSKQRTALIEASILNNTVLARFFVNRGADKSLCDSSEKKAIDYALTEKMKKECTMIHQ